MAHLSLKTARNRTLYRRAVRQPPRRPGVPARHSSAGAAIQIFISRYDAFLGTEVFGAERPLVVGRHRDAGLRLEADTISRRHCQISLDGDRIVVEDLQTPNGTLVNRARIARKIAVQPSDAIHIGPYTLKIRPLIPENARKRRESGISNADTRIEALLTTDSTSSGLEDAPIDLPDGVDRQLYEEAILRATGRELPRNVVPLRLVHSQEELEDTDWEYEREPSTPAILGVPFGTEEETDLSGANARIEQLEALISVMDRETSRTQRKPSMRRRPELDEPSDVWEQVEADSDDVWGYSIVDSRSIAEMTNTAFERYLAAELGSPAGKPINRRSSTRPDRPSQFGISVKADPAERRPTLDRNAFAIIPSVGMPANEEHARESQIDHEASTALADAEDPLIISSRSAATDLEPRIIPLPRSGTSVPGIEAERSRIVARLVTPTNRESAQPAADDIPLADDVDVFEDPDTTSATEEVPVGEMFAAIEIAARSGDKLLDIATLRRPGEQYVLGHRTPQGAIAPHCCHEGLRVLRLTQDRHVDLVFPKDVAGHLIREGGDRCAPRADPRPQVLLPSASASGHRHVDPPGRWRADLVSPPVPALAALLKFHISVRASRTATHVLPS